MSYEAVLLLVLLNTCHWAADYTHLSNKKMLSAKRLGTPLLPIIEHACRHGLLMVIVFIFFGLTVKLIIAAYLFEVLTHFGIDVLKGRLNKWFPNLSNPTNPYHWYVFGADQFLHQLVIILITFFVLSK